MAISYDAEDGGLGLQTDMAVSPNWFNRNTCCESSLGGSRGSSHWIVAGGGVVGRRRLRIINAIEQLGPVVPDGVLLDVLASSTT
jgi:hypothetical protein